MEMTLPSLNIENKASIYVPCWFKVVELVIVVVVSNSVCHPSMVWAVMKTVKVLAGKGTNCTNCTNHTNH